MKVDPANQIAETNEDDNMATKTIQVASGLTPPDLFWNISVTPNPLSPHAETTVPIRANFCLNRETVNNLKVKATIDGAQIWENIYPTFDHGCADAIFNWVAVEGSHQIAVILDPDNTITEHYEDNNETHTSINVQPALPQEKNGPGDPYWDTTFSSDGWEIQPKATGLMPNDNVRLGAKIRYTGSTMDNLRIKCGTGNTVLFNGGFTNLTDGIERTITFDYKTPLASGAKIRIYCQIDPDQTRNDTNRSNNLIETEIETIEMIQQNDLGVSQVVSDLGPCAIIGAPADLELTTLNQYDSSAEKVKFVFLVKNNGQGCIKKFQWRVNDETGALLADGWEMKVNISNPNKHDVKPVDEWLLKAGESKKITRYIYKKDIKSNCYRPSPTDVYIICPNIKYTVDPNNIINDPNRSSNEKTQMLKFFTPW